TAYIADLVVLLPSLKIEGLKEISKIFYSYLFIFGFNELSKIQTY
ncbi:MAG: hypothetical protein ACI87N_001611, partial [Flavobacteriales bacterium]